MRTNIEEIEDILILSNRGIEKAMYMTIDEAIDERDWDLKIIAMNLEDINYKNKKR